MRVKVDVHLKDYKIEWIMSFGFTEAQAGLIKRGQLELYIDDSLGKQMLNSICTRVDEPKPKVDKIKRIFIDEYKET